MSVKKQFGSFDELLESSELPVLVDFYAPWCGPCQLMTGILDKVSETMKDTVQIVKINTDNYPEIASQYKVFALPTLVLFKDGEPVDRVEGVIQADQLCDRLSKHLTVHAQYYGAALPPNQSNLKADLKPKKGNL